MLVAWLVERSANSRRPERTGHPRAGDGVFRGRGIYLNGSSSMGSPAFHLGDRLGQQRAASRQDRSAGLLPILVVLLWAMAAGVSADQLAALSASHRAMPLDQVVQRAITETRVSRRIELRDEHKPAEALAIWGPLVVGAIGERSSVIAASASVMQPWCCWAACGLLAVPPPVG